MNLCDRCGVEIKGNDKRETENHCGFCSGKLGLKPKMEYGQMNVITDPQNSTHFIIIGILIVIGSIILFSATGQLDSYFEGKDTDKKIADTIKNQELTDDFCENLKTLRSDIRSNVYSEDSIKMIDAKLLECQFNKIFPDLELKMVGNRK